MKPSSATPHEGSAEHEAFTKWWDAQKLGHKDNWERERAYRMTAWNGWLARSFVRSEIAEPYSRPVVSNVVAETPLSASGPKIVYEVSNKTSSALFATPEAAHRYMSGISASVAGGMSLTERPICE